MLVKKTVEEFLSKVASSEPAPGGGSVAALAGANGAGLFAMVCRVTIGKEKYAHVEEDLKTALEQLISLQKRLTELVDEDTEAFNDVMAAFKMPKESDSEKEARKAAIQAGYKRASNTPMETAECCCKVLELGKIVAEKGNSNAISDVGVGALTAIAGLHGAVYNVKINIPTIKDEEFVRKASEKIEWLIKTGGDCKRSILESVDKRGGF